MPEWPLVTVICLCHAQGPYVQAALRSVAALDYPSVELIIVDDGSRDESVEQIRAQMACWADDSPFVRLLALFHPTPLGNCRAFNSGLRLAQGRYVIDLAADDCLCPDGLRLMVRRLEEAGPDWGVAFADIRYMDARGRTGRTYYDRDASGRLRRPVPEGAVFHHLVGNAFLPTVSMLMRRSMLEAIGGYNEALSYEDYDLWVRTGRQWKYAFCDLIAVHKREIPHSHSRQFYRRRANRHLPSTLAIHRYALALVREEAEKDGLATSVRYHLHMAVLTDNHAMAPAFGQVLRALEREHTGDRLWQHVAGLHLPVAWLYQYWIRWQEYRRYGW